MHRLINRSIRHFLVQNYGVGLWSLVAADAGLELDGFDLSVGADCRPADRVVDAAARRLRRDRNALLEDLGIHLAMLEPVRRVLRFGGATFTDFLLSLGELPGRVRMALPDVYFPSIDVEEAGPGRFIVRVQGDMAECPAIFAGTLRAMADDYGALVLIDQPGGDTLRVDLLDDHFTAGRPFDLALPGAA